MPTRRFVRSKQIDCLILILGENDLLTVDGEIKEEYCQNPQALLLAG